MKTTSIKNILELKFGIKDNYTDEEYNQIKSISINRFEVNGEISNIDFTELIKLNNLESLTISNCIIDTNNMSIITLLYNLKTLILLNCEIIEDISPFLMQLKIENLIIDNTNLNLKVLEYLHLNSIILSNIDINSPLQINTNKLDIRKSNIKDYSYINLNEINTLIISNTQYENNINIFSNFPNHLVVMEDNGQFIKLEVNR